MLNQNSRQADFVLGTCPSCQKVVRIPVTAVTSQSKSQVGCPICEANFEIAEILEETIPEVHVVDTEPVSNKNGSNKTNNNEAAESRPDRINAIDTPELFHVSKDDYKPTTEKKNGRFVVPSLLSKGIKKKRKRKRSRRRQSDPKLAESLAKLKENTSTTSLPESRSDETSRSDSESRGRSSSGSKSRDRDRERSRRSRSKSSSSASSDSRHSSSGNGKKDSEPKLKREKTFGNWLRSLQSQTKQRIQNFRSFGVGKPDSRFEFVMIGLGVLMAIPLLHVLLWWFAGIDPFSLAKPASRIAPFIVPNAMRAAEEPVEEEEPAATRNYRETKVPEFQPPERIKRDSSGKLPKPKIDPSSIHNNHDF